MGLKYFWTAASSGFNKVNKKWKDNGFSRRTIFVKLLPQLCARTRYHNLQLRRSSPFHSKSTILLQSPGYYTLTSTSILLSTLTCYILYNPYLHLTLLLASLCPPPLSYHLSHSTQTVLCFRIVIVSSHTAYRSVRRINDRRYSFGCYHSLYTASKYIARLQPKSSGIWCPPWNSIKLPAGAFEFLPRIGRFRVLSRLDTRSSKRKLGKRVTHGSSV